MSLFIEPDIVDAGRRRAAIARLREMKVTLPTWSELAHPADIAGQPSPDLSGVDADAPDAANLWRVHWFNDAGRKKRVAVPGHVVLPSELTGVPAPIVVLFGRRFPMIGAHKVLAAYACLVPRLVTGQFDPSHDRAVWPSTGNYCRGGVAISRILGCRGVAVLPAGMSRERFDWLQQWVAEPSDIIRTPGTESNVKEIYDKCAELARDRKNVILNQFSEFAELSHPLSLHRERVRPGLRPSPARASGLSAWQPSSVPAGRQERSAPAIASRRCIGSKIAAVEAIECPTMLYNGHGEHNIQGIGDKHIPLIHNVMNTDVVIGVSDAASDALNLLFGSERGRGYLSRRRKIDPDLVRQFDDIGISGLANIVAADQARQAF